MCNDHWIHSCVDIERQGGQTLTGGLFILIMIVFMIVTVIVIMIMMIVIVIMIIMIIMMKILSFSLLCRSACTRKISCNRVEFNLSQHRIQRELNFC